MEAMVEAFLSKMEKLNPDFPPESSTIPMADDDENYTYDDVEEEDFKKARAKELGFEPQKEHTGLQWLPYADKIDAESKDNFSKIKTNLAKCIALRQFRPGYLEWTNRLIKYMRLYKFKFTKEDQLQLIKMFWSVIHIPELDRVVVFKTSACLSWLLRRRDTLKPSDLTLDWRPLHKLYERIVYSPHLSLCLVYNPM